MQYQNLLPDLSPCDPHSYSVYPCGHVLFMPDKMISALKRWMLCMSREMIPFIKGNCHPLEEGSFFSSLFFF